jgi:hypothetical protein
MAAAATAPRRAPAAPRRAPARTRRAPARKTSRPRPQLRRARPNRAPASSAPGRRIYAGAALFPQAAVRSAGAVRDISDSSLIVRLTRGRGWIAVLCALLGGIVALNVISLSLTAGSGRLSIQIDELQTQNSALRAEIAERLSASRVETAASTLGLAVPDPEQISYLSAGDGDASKLARLLDDDSFLTEPSQPSSYPAPGTSYTTTSSASTPSSASTTSAPVSAPAPSSSGGSTGSGSSGGAAQSGSTAGPTAGSTGGVGL